jgi:sigma-B regulation protein RsbU (phosphoserine phosphatase)
MKTGTTSIFKSIFQGLDEDSLDSLRGVAEIRKYPPQTVLCHQGEVEHTFYVVVEGRVAITQKLADGEERLLSIRQPREYFGELGLLDDTPRMADCVTITDVTVLEITEEVFDSVLENSPAVARTIMRHTVTMLRSNDKLSIADLIDKNEELQEAYDELKAAQAEIIEKERLERELETAAGMQRTLLPTSLPEYPDYSFAAYLQPARFVGGDFYDALALDDEHVGLLLADVADKSVQAALFMAVSRTLFMVEGRRSLSPAEVALAVHRGVIDVAPSADIFVTAFYGVLHRPTGRLTYISAGHELPLLIRPGEGIVEISGKGRFIGMIENLELEEFEVTVKTGDRMLIFSDGVPDATNMDGVQYGYDRLKRFLNRQQGVAIQQMIDLLAADIAAWTGNAPPFDDLTLLAVEVLDGHGEVSTSS